MASNNQIVLIGRIGHDAADELKYLPSGHAVTEVRLAVDRPVKDPSGKTVTDWLSCKFWNKQAEILAEYVKKGDLISVTGALRIDTWEKDGEKRHKAFIAGENFQMLGGKRQEAALVASGV